ncbi:hypothetical protein, partial [Vampirovibrio chlorellavorus]|uniref:hypothetical protein n=1 Tax=Vampirovibrio chlorellavorus TaxID=758823 RepID=UPI0026EFCA53
LLEYSLIGMLVLVVCVAGLEIFTGEMSQWWQKLWDDMESRQGPAVAITAPPSASASPPKSTSPSTVLEPPLVTENPGSRKFVTRKGTVITLPDTVDNMEDTIKTLGANGTTTILANSLEALIKQLVANREIDGKQAQDLINLANQGHMLAKLQKHTEAAIAKVRTPQDYQAIIQNDSRIAVNDVSGIYSHPLGGYAADEKTLDPLQSDTVAWDATGDFLEAYHAAVASGALNDPAVRVVVDTLTRKISELSSMSSYFFMALANGEISPSEVNRNIAESVSETHNKSAQICNVGEGQDSGTHCSPGG